MGLLPMLHAIFSMRSALYFPSTVLTFPEAASMPNIPANLYPIRNAMGCCHLLVEDDGQSAVLIDAGFFGEMFFLKRLLRRLRLPPTADSRHLGSRTAISITLAASSPSTTGPARPSGRTPRNAPMSRAATPTRACRACAAGWRPPGGPSCASPLGPWTVLLPMATCCRSGAGCGWSTCPGTRAGTAGFTAHGTTSCSAATCSPVTSGTPTGLRPSSTAWPARFAGSFARVAALDPRWIVPNHYDLLEGARLRRRFDRLHARLHPAR